MAEPVLRRRAVAGEQLEAGSAVRQEGGRVSRPRTVRRRERLVHDDVDAGVERHGPGELAGVRVREDPGAARVHHQEIERVVGCEIVRQASRERQER